MSQNVTDHTHHLLEHTYWPTDLPTCSKYITQHSSGQHMMSSLLASAQMFVTKQKIHKLKKLTATLTGHILNRINDGRF